MEDVDQKKRSSWWETFRSMLEPGVRYLPHSGPAALNLDAAVDLSKKSSVGWVSSFSVPVISV